MAIERDVIAAYARDIQRLELAPDRAQKVAGEIERLVESIFALSAASAFAADPDDFLATLHELRDKPDTGNE